MTFKILTPMRLAVVILGLLLWFAAAFPYIRSRGVARFPRLAYRDCSTVFAPRILSEYRPG